MIRRTLMSAMAWTVYEEVCFFMNWINFWQVQSNPLILTIDIGPLVNNCQWKSDVNISVQLIDNREKRVRTHESHTILTANYGKSITTWLAQRCGTYIGLAIRVFSMVFSGDGVKLITKHAISLAHTYLGG